MESAADGKAGLAAALARVPDVVVCDIMMPVLDGYAVLRAVRDHVRTAAVPFIFPSARAERDDVRAGMTLGADDYVTKPFKLRELLEAIETRLERQSAFERASRAPTPPVLPEGAIVESAALREVYARAAKAAPSALSVLLLGETGVGKDVLAHAMHESSERASGPFMPLHCAALPDTLLESELFGHERGAFTGALSAKAGLFETAEGGTVFLDEIGDLPAATQAKLLRVLEDRRVMRVGGRSFREVDVRFIAATNRDLEAEVDAGRFRRDLYYRVAGIVLSVPPLRKRRADIAPLARRFAHDASAALGRGRPAELTPEALAALEQWSWPGNVRELRNAVEQAVTLAAGDRVELDDLPPALLERGGASETEALTRRLREAEKQRVVDALERHGGNQTRAARDLGVSRRTLLNRLDEYGLPRPRKKT